MAGTDSRYKVNQPTPSSREIMKAQMGVEVKCQNCALDWVKGYSKKVNRCRCAEALKRREYVVAWLKGRAKRAEFGE